MSSVPSQLIRPMLPRIRPSPRVWYSSAEVVITVFTLVPPMTLAATSRYRSSRQTSAVAPQSRRMRSSSRSLFIGLTATAIPPAFQVPMHGDDELRHVLQEQRHPLARGDTRVGQPSSERAGQFVQLAPGQHTVEVADDRGARVPLDTGAEHVQHGAELHLDVVRLALVVAGQPGPLIVAAHRANQSPRAAGTPVGRHSFPQPTP